MVADTRKWLPGRKVLISPVSLGTPKWERSRFPVKLTQQQVKKSPEYREKIMNRGYEEKLFGHYGVRPYWEGRSEEEVLKKGATRLPPD
jgi:hypothetical protein